MTITAAPPDRIGVLGPITLSDFADFLAPSASRDAPRGQGGTPVNMLCREFLRRGVGLTIFTLAAGIAEERILEGPRLRICVVPLRPAPARDLFSVERHGLTAAIRRERPPFLHAHWVYYYALAAQASGLRHLITAHDAPLNVLRRHFIPHRVAHTVMAYMVLARARNVVSVSPYVADHIRRWMLYRGPRTVIPVGLPDEVFDLRRERSPRPDSTVFASVLTGWDELKNGKALVEAFSRVVAERPRDRLLLIGPGHESGGPAEAWARSRNMHRSVEFVGPIAHPAVLDRLATEVDVYVHPSREEACSMALAEALAIGVPAIGGRKSGGVPYSLDHGQAGVLVDVDPEGLAGAMLRLAGDPAERRRLVERGRAYAREHFHVRRVAEDYLSLYAALFG